MIKEHMHRHGQTYFQHFKNNWYFTKQALKAAFYTFGHGLHPGISGMRASELHNELWMEGRKLSIEDISHRLSAGLYANKEEAIKEYREYASVYNEEPVFKSFIQVIDAHFDGK
jgi:hypothetical protein